MSRDTKELARRVFEPAVSPGSKAIALESLTVHLRADEQAETVLLRGKGHEVTFTCTCGRQNCAHIAWVLQKLLGSTEPDSLTDAPAATRISEPPPQRLSVTGSLRVVESARGPLLGDKAMLAERLEDLVTAVVRAGAGARGSPSVEDALKLLIDSAPKPLPLGFERWLGRTKSGLAREDLHRLARMLYGGCLSLEALRDPADPMRRQLAAWFGNQRQSYGEPWQADRIQDHILVEVAREWLPGAHRAAIERRYLINVDTGEVYCEDRQGGDMRVSAGPCPRLIHVGLAHIEAGIPKRIRLFQYVVSGRISAADWAKVKLSAIRRFRPLAQTYREAIKTFPALAEPFVLVRPARFEHEGVPIPLDEEDIPLPLAGAENPAELEWISSIVKRGDVQWMAGRLVDAEHCLMLRVRSIAVLEGHEIRHHRIS
ncbi:MAG: hypothetical protein H6715_03905 [Myxococcales bacterium]|nr:hypothetical protein [Myxococcales bacterium]MCB9708653.1 hypothetical protein [Myxococcales bacterium]